MSGAEFLKLLEGTIVIGGLAAIVFAVFKNSTVKATISSQKELIETLTGQIEALRQDYADLNHKHIQNEKAISKLQGQVEVYKELPLSDLAQSVRQIATTQKQILQIIKK